MGPMAIGGVVGGMVLPSKQLRAASIGASATTFSECQSNFRWGLAEFEHTSPHAGEGRMERAIAHCQAAVEFCIKTGSK
jgi:hypothetical protein